MTRRQLVIVAVLGHVAIAVWCVITSVRNSFDPGHYYQFFRHPERFVPPVDDIAWWCGAIGIEVTVASWVLKLVPSTAAASFVLALVAGLATLVLAPLAMHAPPYYGMHIVFTAFSTAWLCLVAIVAKLAGPGRKLVDPPLPSAVIRSRRSPR
jgi:hypothetical protein